MSAYMANTPKFTRFRLVQRSLFFGEVPIYFLEADTRTSAAKVHFVPQSRPIPLPRLVCDCVLQRGQETLFVIASY